MPTKSKKGKTSPRKKTASKRKNTTNSRSGKARIKRKKRTAKPKKRIILLRFFLISSVLVLISIVLSYLYIDHKVKKHLRTGSDLTASMIYSNYSEIPKKRSVSIEHAYKILALHRYQESTVGNLRPGEFHKAEEALTIYTREFIGPNGKTFKTKVVSLPIQDKNISIDPENIRTAFLQPEALSPIAYGSIDARKYMRLDQFPESIRQAVLVTEDERFYEHFGIDLFGILRAIFTNITQGSFRQGASTITQQLAKNTLFTHEKTLKRKYLEALAAISLERHLSKSEILEKYLNEVYLGQSGSVAVHGIPAASQFFFNKTVDQLTIPEAALLAGLIKAPSYYSPHRHPKRAAERRNLILSKMEEKGIINPKQQSLSKQINIKVQPKKYYQNKSPFFIQALRNELNKDFNLNSFGKSGLKVFTGINLNLQKCAETALKNGLNDLEKNYKKLAPGSLEAGLVAIETYSGLIKAWVGGRNYSSNQFDHVYQAKRQIGSTIKPFVYLTALDSSLNDYRVATPITILNDKPIKIEQINQDTWTPKNYDGNFRGAVTLRYALERSLNIPAVYVTQKVTPAKVANTVKMLNLSKNPLAVPSIALGAIESSLLDLTTAFAALANGGILIKPRLYISIVDRYNQIVANSKIQERRIADENAVFVLSNILMGVIERGTARKARALGLKTKAAGKTGTTNEGRDAWFVGYTSDLAAGVWVGLDDNSPLNLTGSQAALPIWTEFMKCSQASLKDSSFIAPYGVTYELIDSATGMLYHEGCQGEPVKEIFITGTEPVRYCDHFQQKDPTPTKLTPRRKPREEKGILDLLFG